LEFNPDGKFCNDERRRRCEKDPPVVEEEEEACDGLKDARLPDQRHFDPLAVRHYAGVLCNQSSIGLVLISQLTAQMQPFGLLP